MRWSCEACGQAVTRRAVETGAACPHCGEEALVREDGEEGESREAAPRDDSPLEAEEVGDAPPPEIVPCAAPLVRPVGGLQRGRVAYVTGEPASGKTTECYRVAVALGARAVALDAEMSATECATYFRRVGATDAYLRRCVRRVGGRAGQWREALERADEQEPEILIVDSLHAWAGRDEREREACMRALVELCEATGIIALVVAHWSRGGHASGETTAEHWAEATFVLRANPATVEVTKCRWSPARGRFSRGPVRTGESARATRPEPSPWKILGVSERATAEEVKRAWRKAIALVHPDRVARATAEEQAAAAARAVALNVAYEALKARPA